MVKFVVDVVDVEERRHEIEAKREKSSEKRPFYAYSSDLTLKIIDLPIGLPIYRLDNARTKSAQVRWIHDKKLPKDFFKNSQEDVEVQRYQHEILLRFAHEGPGSESETDIYTVLQQDKKQTDEILVTADGVIVNGNRRVAAMRELYKSGEFPSFEHVRAMVLPATMDHNDILKIEVRLQVTPQTILPYEWMDEAMLIQDLRAAKIDDEEIRKMMRKNKVSEIQDLVDRWTEAQIYLAETVKDEDDYFAVKPHEQQFIELQKALKNKKPSEKEAARKIHHIITYHAADTEQRLYNYRTAYGDKMMSVLDEFAKRSKITLSEPKTNGTAPPSGDIFAGGAEIDEKADSIKRYKPVLDVLAKHTKEDAKLIREITEELNEVQKDKNVGELPLRNLDKAARFIDAVNVGQATAATHARMRDLVKKIAKQAAAIEAALK